MEKTLRLTIPENEIEAGALDQIDDAMEIPSLKALAIMPDVHMGYDLPIGGVALLDNHIWPGAVGYDIGCGMCHIDTTKSLKDLPPLQDIYERIANIIPVGFTTRKSPTTRFKKFPNGSKFAAVADAIYSRASIQLGTLGGGNHFIEIGVNKLGSVGVTIHSGSRRPGWLLGDFYMKMTGGPVPLDSKMGSAYVKDMKWALQFALDNRSEMMAKCFQAMGLNFKDHKSKMINENHNHAEITRDGVLHRKGATPAMEGQQGIIPANMKDGVYITVGLGNEEFLSSASHGAGRTMSRTKAKKTLSMGGFISQMEGIISPDLTNLLDEAPGAYKNIDKVISDQDGILVNIIDHFKPVLVVKG